MLGCSDWAQRHMEMQLGANDISIFPPEPDCSCVRWNSISPGIAYTLSLPLLGSDTAGNGGKGHFLQDPNRIMILHSGVFESNMVSNFISIDHIETRLV